MKKQAFLLAIILLLVIVLPTYAQNGVTGRLYDGLPADGDPDLPWEHGADIYILNCDVNGNLLATEIYGSIRLDGTEIPTGQFTTSDWTVDDLTVKDTDPATGDYICLFVVWNYGGVNTPPPVLTRAFPYLSFITTPLSFGNIQSGTGPTAIQLQQVDVTNTNTLLPIGISLLLLAVATLTLFYRRRQA